MTLTMPLTLLDELAGAYADVVDNRQFERWPGLFTDTCFYAVYGMENVERGLPLAYMLDDCRERLLDRVKFITQVWEGTVQPYRARHTIQRTRTREIDSGLYEVHANFLVGFTDVDGSAGLLASGHYEDRITVSQGEARFVEKRAFLDNVPPRYLVDPL